MFTRKKVAVVLWYSPEKNLQGQLEQGIKVIEFACVSPIKETLKEDQSRNTIV